MKRDFRLTALAFLLWGAGEGLFLYIQPLYIRQLGASPAQIGGVLSLTALAAGLTYIPSGYLSDRFSPKQVLLGGWVSGLLAVLIAAAARDWRGLIPGLVLYGLSAYCIPAVHAYLATAAEGRDLERVFTTTFAAYTAGAVISPVVGGMVAERISMRAAYLFAAGLFALSTAAISSISPRPPAGLRHCRGLTPLVSTPFWRFAGAVLFSCFAMYLVFPLAPNFLVEVRGLSTAQVGALGSVYAIGTTVVSLALGQLRGGGRPWGLLLAQGLVWLSAGLLLWAPGLGGAALAYLLQGSYQACRPLARAQAGNLLETAQRGLMLGATETVIAAAQVLAPAVAGWLYAGQPARPFLAALALIPLGIILTATLATRNST